jgi:hypothetical protein
MDRLQVERCGSKPTYVHCNKTRPILTLQHPGRGEWLRYSCKYILLLSNFIHRFLGSPGLAKPIPGRPAFPGVPTRLGSLL